MIDRYGMEMVLKDHLSKYKALFNVVRDLTREGNQSHGIDHALMVAQNGWRIAQDERIAELAWIAGLMHDVVHRSIDERCRQYILHTLFEAIPGVALSEEEAIGYAIRKHSMLNDAGDSPLLVVLKDADRISNLGLLNLGRGGQQHPELPSMVLGYFGATPGSTFKKPASWIDLLQYNLEWETMLRTPRAIVIAAPFFAELRRLLCEHESQFRDAGLTEVLRDIL